jgi:hypothetical protein
MRNRLFGGEIPLAQYRLKKRDSITCVLLMDVV